MLKLHRKFTNFRSELKIIRYASFVKAFSLTLVMFVTRTSIFISMVTFALLGNLINAKEAFVITSFYNFIRHTMTVMFPLSIIMLAEGLASIKRIEKFMMQEEIVKDPQTLISLKTDYILSGKDIDNISTSKIHLHRLKAKWNPKSIDPTLEGINLEIHSGSLTIVIGTIGSGKSSLLQTILGELSLEGGMLKTNGTYSYCSQEPWLFSGSLRQNILFDMEMNKERYKTVLNACSLNQDIEGWPERDNTVIGERGHKLSGGQKARVKYLSIDYLCSLKF